MVVAIHEIVIRVLVQDGSLGGEDDVGVEGLVGGGELAHSLLWPTVRRVWPRL